MELSLADLEGGVEGAPPPPLKFSKIRILVHNDKCAHISVNS